MLKSTFIGGILTIFVLCISCKNDGPGRLETAEAYSKTAYESRHLDENFKKYWYSGEAEITSYQLDQPRYGEMRNGKAILIFVTEDFLPDEQVKANAQNEKNIPVLKFNRTKDFVTGIYPYSIMSSVFYPVNEKSHAIKLSASVQEWCGQQYMQLNNRGNFEVTVHSYFEGEADQHFSIQKNILEDELWAQLRIEPDSLPTGKQEVIPSLEYTRLSHAEFKAYNANITKTDSTYTIFYPDLKRTLTLNFTVNFPYEINGWQESTPNGSGADAQILTANATKIKTLKTAYWKENAGKFEFLRDSLGL